MTRAIVIWMWSLLAVVSSSEVWAGTIYVQSIPNPVVPGSTDNVLNILVELNASDITAISPNMLNGYEFELEFDSGAGISIVDGVFRSDTFTDLLPLMGLGGGSAPATTDLTASGLHQLPGHNTTNPAAGIYGLASIFFDVDASATSGLITPKLLTGKLFSPERADILLTFSSSSPGGITIMGASSSGPGGTVPEPASVVVWSILGLVGVTRARRHKGKVAVA